MSDEMTLGAELAQLTSDVLEQSAAAIDDLSLEQLHYRAGDDCNSIAFDAWHVARTADNLIHFAFAREMPVWLQQGLNEAWSLPKADQGTLMSPEDAHALRFPEADKLAKYCRDVKDVVVPKIAAMSDEYLAGTYMYESPLKPPLYALLIPIPVGATALCIQFMRRTYGYYCKWETEKADMPAGNGQE